MSEAEEDRLVVVLAELGDLGSAYPADVGRIHADRPIWFHRTEDGAEVTVFDQVPEGPMASSLSAKIMAAVRSFGTAHSDELQELLGSADSISVGFHTDADVDEVEAAFVADGFDVVRGLIQRGTFAWDDD